MRYRKGPNNGRCLPRYLPVCIADMPDCLHYQNGQRKGGGEESAPRPFDKFNGEQFRDNSDGELLLLFVRKTSCIGTLILHITYPSPQLFYELNERVKCSMGKVHVSRYETYVMFPPHHTFLEEIQ